MPDSRPDLARELHRRLSADLRPAMKSRDTVRVRTIRSLMSAIDNAGAVAITDPRGPEDPAVGLGAAETSRRVLAGHELRAILDAELQERREAAEARLSLGRDEDAAEFETEAAIIRGYLELLDT